MKSIFQRSALRVPQPAGAPRGVLSRLRSDARGNTIALAAVALVPIAAFAGSAVDTARLYVVKVRLQQACDAGALAGRKVLLDSNSTTIDAAAAAQAQAFFANNFRTGWMATHTVNFTPAKTPDHQVSATATATVPMTVMKLFRMPDVALRVACEARYDVPDLDIMMVLDTTGSMACTPTEAAPCGQPTESYTRSDGTTGYSVTEKFNSRIKALRSAVLNFYDTVANNSDPSTHVRYGFVPYTSTVNAGYQIPSNFLLSTSWNYQTRRIIGDSNAGSPSQTTYTAVTRATCDGYAGRTPATGFDTSGNATVRTVSWTADATGTTGTCVVTRQGVEPIWRYAQFPADVSQYVQGLQVQDPSKYTTALTRWQGCLEERPTTASTSFDADSLPADLDPDLEPTNDATRWRPMWPEQIYMRSSTASVDVVDGAPSNIPNIGRDPTYLKAGYVSCGKAVQRLATLTRAEVNSFLTAPEFRPLGGTYHDVGMIWGARFISPSGPFGADTAPWPGRNAPNRHIVFMTDGEMAPSTTIYGMYGNEGLDRRVANGDTATLTARHNARFRAVCDAARARNIKVWVIAFGQALTDDLKGCAAQPWQEHAFFAGNSTSLQAAFQAIAAKVAVLRVSR